AATDDDRLQVQQVLCVRQRHAQGPDRLVDQVHGDRVVTGQRLGDHPTGGPVTAPLLHDVEEFCSLAPGPPAPGGRLDGSAAGIGLQVASLAAPAPAPSVPDHGVADLAGGAKTTVQLAAED